jgi:hypothetical protein
MKLIATRADRHAQPVARHAIWTPEAVRSLGLTTDIETAGAILGIGRTKAYELAKTGDFPIPLLRAGRRYLVPVPALLRLLGADDREPARRSGQ